MISVAHGEQRTDCGESGVRNWKTRLVAPKVVALGKLAGVSRLANVEATVAARKD